MRIAVAGGGTGGHFFPAISVAKKLKERGHDVLYFGTENGIEFKLKEKIPVDSVFVNVKGLRGKGFLGFFKGSFLMFKAFLKVLSIVKRFNPDRFVVFGGYASLPLGLSSLLLGKSLIVHEQNSIPGKTNLILSKFSEKILIGNKYAEKYFKSAKFVGNPVREEISSCGISKEEALRRFGLDRDRFTVLVFGGSQGSKRINQVILSLLDILKLDIQFIHLVGKGDVRAVKETYLIKGFKAYVDSFIHDPWNAYAACDIAVSRSGAMSLAELSYFKVPSIFIPYPFAVDDHQYYNVKQIFDSGGCFLIRESDLTPESILNAVKVLYEDANLRKRFSSVMESFSVENSADLIVEEIVDGS